MGRNNGKRLGMATRVLIAGLLMGQLFGCAAGMELAPDELDDAVAETEGPLGGEALAQRYTDLDRAWRDLQHFDVTMKTLVDRRDSRSVALLDGFLEQYMAEYLNPMLRPAWQSSHPELMALDANLRFMKAQILADMRYPRKVQAAVDDIEERFYGREGMLVEYPVGTQRSLGEAIDILIEQKWNN